MKAFNKHTQWWSSATKAVAFFPCMRYTLDVPQRLWPRRGSSGSVYNEVFTGLLMVTLSATVYAGTLTPGKPRVESDRYEVPIYLNGAGNEVAALDFSLTYDPAVFQPVSISPGAVASAAGKLVTANLPEPGNYIVVMMGFNQTPVANGEVARIVLERVGSSGQSETTLTVNSPTLSTWEGVEVPAEGGAAAVTVTPKDEKPTGENDTKPDAEKPEKPATPAEGQAPSVKPRGNPMLTAAGDVAGSTPGYGRSKVEADGKKAAAPGTAAVDSMVPDVAAAAAKAVEERGRLGEASTGSQPGADAKTSSTAINQDGQAARSTDTQTSRSFIIEESDPVNNNTAGSTQPDGTQRESAIAKGWMRLGLAAAVLLAVAGGAWLLRSRIFR